MKKFLFLFFLSSFCANIEEKSSLGIYFATLSTDKCIATGNGDSNLPEEVEKIVVRITKKDNKSPIIIEYSKAYSKESLTKHGEIVVEKINVGENYKVEVFGCDKNNVVQWSGERENVSVYEHEKTFPSIYLTKKGEINCTGNEKKINQMLIGSKDMLSQRAFFTSTLLSSNDVLISGGVSKGDMEFEATNSIEIYRHDLGIFQPYGNMQNKRACHLSFLMDNGTILFIGGSKKLKLVQSGVTPPITPFNLVDTAELFSISKKEKINEITSPKFATASSILLKNEVLISGGYEEDGKESKKIIKFSLDKEKFIKGNIEFKEGSLKYERVGHSLTLLKDGAILVWGGRKSPLAEIIRNGEVNGEDVEVYIVNGVIPTSFHSALFFDEKILIFGGIERTGSSQSFTPKAEKSQVLLLEIKKTGETYSIFVNTLKTKEKSYLFKRAYHVSEFLGNKTFFVGGGFNSFTKSEIEECKDKSICFLSSAFLFNLVGDTINIGKELSLNSERVGHAILQLKDKTFLTLGGFSVSSDGKKNTISKNAEIYNHPDEALNELCKTPIEVEK